MSFGRWVAWIACVVFGASTGCYDSRSVEGGPRVPYGWDGGPVVVGDGAIDSDGWELDAGSRPEQDGGTAGPLPSTGQLLHEGEGRLVDVFVTDASIVVVSDRTVFQYDRGGVLLAATDFPREITAAAFDGSILAIADRAVLKAFTPALEEVASFELVESCASGAIVAGSRFVCGPENDWDRIFYTFDLATGERLPVSDPYTYNGIPMRHVPGTDHFVTTTIDLSPSDFHLYQVDADGQVQYLNESPYHGDFEVRAVFAFEGTPAEFLITHEGRKLRIFGSGCGGELSIPAGCFVQAGVLGTLHGAERFIAMAEDADHVYGVVSTTDGFFEPSCASSLCRVQAIDPSGRVIVSEELHRLRVVASVVLRHDPSSDRLVFGYYTERDYFAAEGTFEVRLLPY